MGSGMTPNAVMRNASRRRRGSVYVVVLGAATIVMVIGLSALLAGRIQHRAVRDTTDFAQARLNALAAIDIGLLLIRQNPDDWRDDFAAGNLPTNLPVGSGSISLEAIDPVDGDLTDNDGDPVLLTGIGLKGLARCKLQVRLEPQGAGMVVISGTWRQVVD